MQSEVLDRSGGREARTTQTTIIVVHILILALIALCAPIYLSSVLQVQAEALIIPASILLLLTCAWHLWSWRILTGGFFDPYELFLIAAAIFNGGQAFLAIFGLNKFGILDGRFSPETVLQTIFLATLGIAAFHAGGLFSIFFSKGNSQSGRIAHAPLETRKALRIVGWGLLAISAIPAFFIFRDSISVVLAFGYFGIFKPGPGPGVNDARVLADLIIPGSLFLLAGSKNLRFNIYLAASVIFLYSSIVFFIGSRQGATMLLVAGAWVFHRCIRPIPRTLLLLASAFLLFVVFPVVSVFRNSTGGQRLSLKELYTAFASVDNPAVAILHEMGSTMRITAHTIELVPGYRVFDLGASYLYAMSAVIPNLFWSGYHPASMHELNIWLVQIADPSLANLGNALGFSFIAEAYLNFGWIGAPIALGIMGFLLGRFILWAQWSADPLKIAMVGAFTGFFLLFARGESVILFRPLIWYALFPYLSVLVLTYFFKPKFANERPDGHEEADLEKRPAPSTPS